MIRGDVYPLDAEWARRYPQMIGRLACNDCALGDRYAWDCTRRRDCFVPGHIASTMLGPGGVDIDHWSHVGSPHTQLAAVSAFPEHAVAQGAEDFVRWVVTSRRGTSATVRARLAAALPDRR